MNMLVAFRNQFLRHN